MEPLFFKAENRRGNSRYGVQYAGASMEPLFFKAENTLRMFRRGRLEEASMEPLFFKAEN